MTLYVTLELDQAEIERLQQEDPQYSKMIKNMKTPKPPMDSAEVCKTQFEMANDKSTDSKLSTSPPRDTSYLNGFHFNTFDRSF